MDIEQLRSRLKTLASDARVELVDLTGTRDHWQATIVSSAFAGRSSLERHKMVFSLVSQEIESNEVHALTLKTYTPEQFAKLEPRGSLK